MSDLKRKEENLTLGVMLILLSAFSFALMSLFVRLSGDIPTIQKAFFRNLIAFLVSFSVVVSSRGKIKPSKQNLPFLLIRSILGTIGVACYFYTIDHLHLSDAAMLNLLSPFFVIIFAHIFLKEKMTWGQIIGLFICFLGALFVVKPQANFTDMIPPLVGLTGGIAAGGAYTAVRALGIRGEDPSVIVVFFAAFSTLFFLPILLLNYRPMTWAQAFYLLLAGIFATVGQYSLTFGYRYASPAKISVFNYSNILFAGLFGFTLLDELPDLYSFLGYLLLLSASIWIFFYNKRLIQKETTLN